MYDDNQEQDKQKSSIDSVNEFVKRTQGHYKNIKRSRRVFKLVFQSIRAALTTNTWVTVVVGAFGFIIFIIILTSVLTAVTGLPTTVGGEPPPATGVCSGTCQTAACLPPNIEDTTATSCDKDKGEICCSVPLTNASCAPDKNPAVYLKQNFNVVVTGTTNNNDISMVCNTFVHDSQAANYKTLLTNGGSLTIQMNAPIARCSGFTPGPNLIQLGPCNAPLTSKEFLLTHESGHLIKDRNSVLFSRYPWGALRLQDRGCYSSDGFLISYPLRYTCNGVNYTDITGRSESFAESIADYIYYTSYNPSGNKCAVALPNFPSQCPNTYSWFENYVFNGYTF